jgi:thioredoxin reductase (NADPH)
MPTTQRRVIVIGGGPAGYTAMIYAARAGLQPLCIEGFDSGGQIIRSPRIDNFPGFPGGVVGTDLADLMRRQAELAGGEFLFDDVIELDLSRRPYDIVTSGDTFTTDALILAMGAAPRRLGLPSEAALESRGVAYCAICDGAFFAGRRVAVIGGGNAATEEALQLSSLASRVTLVHRRDEFRASAASLAALRQHADKIEVLTPWEVVEITGAEAGEVTGLLLRNTVDGTRRSLGVDGVFVAVGHIANTSLVEQSLDLDEQGFILTAPRSTNTSVAGVFAAGDVADPRYRQAVTAAGSGCQAALDAERWLLNRADVRMAQSPGR